MARRNMSLSEAVTTNEREPAWEIARLFPLQGQWTDGQYLSFTESMNQLVELVDGRIEVLEMPTKTHQKIVMFLLNAILTFLTKSGAGDAVAAPYRIRLRNETFREPDITIFLTENLHNFGERFGERPDCVIEVVSDDLPSRTRDYEDKRRDYAQAAIPEYWIVDPRDRLITVLKLVEGQYETHGVFHSGEQLISSVLPELAIDVAGIMATVTLK